MTKKAILDGMIAIELFIAQPVLEGKENPGK